VERTGRLRMTWVRKPKPRKGCKANGRRRRRVIFKDKSIQGKRGKKDLWLHKGKLSTI